MDAAIGGYHPNRKISTMACYDGDNYENHLWTQSLSEDLKWLFAGACVYQNTYGYIFGGRKSPFDSSSDLHAIDYEGNLNKIEIQTAARWGHTLHSISDQLYLIGGRDLHIVLDTIEELKLQTSKETALLKIYGQQTRCTKLKFGIYGHASSIYKEQIVISGGLQNSTRCDVNKQLIIYDPKDHSLRYIDVVNLFPRFSHTSHVTDRGALIQVGGVVMSSLDVIITCIDLKTFLVTNFQPDIPPAVPLVNHCSICDDQEIKIFGGGTNCKSIDNSYVHCTLCNTYLIYIPLFFSRFQLRYARQQDNLFCKS